MATRASPGAPAVVASVIAARPRNVVSPVLAIQPLPIIVRMSSPWDGSERTNVPREWLASAPVTVTISLRVASKAVNRPGASAAS